MRRFVLAKTRLIERWTAVLTANLFVALESVFEDWRSPAKEKGPRNNVPEALLNPKQAENPTSANQCQESRERSNVGLAGGFLLPN